MSCGERVSTTILAIVALGDGSGLDAGVASAALGEPPCLPVSSSASKQEYAPHLNVPYALWPRAPANVSRPMTTMFGILRQQVSDWGKV